MPYPTPRASLAIVLLASGCVASDTSVLDEPQAVSAPSSVNDLLEAMAHDLGTIAPADRANIRYVTLAHLVEAGAGTADLATYRAATSLALNSLSRGRAVTQPVPVDEHATIFRIRLDDYGWDATTWQRLVDDYPYSVRYDRDSEWFEFRDDLADELRAGTRSPVPYVYGDWLVSAAMQPSLYYDLLELPDTLAGLENQLGIDTVQATDEAQVDRAGFVKSGVSTANRMIARFALPARGSLWMSCDLAAGWSILDEPVDPPCERREVIFTLPNGLPAYYVEATDRDGEVRTGLSCTNCHGVTGTIPKNDEVRDYVLTNGTWDDLDDVLALYPPRAEMFDLVSSDQNTFVTARRAAGAPDALAQPLDRVSQTYDKALNARDAAATLGLDEDTFSEMLAASVPAVPTEALVLTRRSGALPRDTWNRIFPAMVSALGLGTSCDPHDGGASCK
jgi:hypothetical protein